MTGDIRLHVSASQTLAMWQSPDLSQEVLRRRFLRYLAANQDALSRLSSPAHLTASVLITNLSVTDVLLILHRKTGRWLQPGGHCEIGDQSLEETAGREAGEETGVKLDLANREPIELDCHPAPCRPDSQVNHYDVRFWMKTNMRSIETDPREITAGRWFRIDQLPEDLDLSTQRLIRRAVDIGVYEANIG